MVCFYRRKRKGVRTGLVFTIAEPTKKLALTSKWEGGWLTRGQNFLGPSTFLEKQGGHGAQLKERKKYAYPQGVLNRS